MFVLTFIDYSVQKWVSLMNGEIKKLREITYFLIEKAIFANGIFAKRCLWKLHVGICYC